jgi:hypothetical protein
MNHVTLTPNEPWAALDAPVSEIILFNLREGTDKKEFVDVLDEFIDKDVHTPGVFSGGWGPIEEDERKFGVLLGWNQVEVLGSVCGLDCGNCLTFVSSVGFQGSHRKSMGP